MPNVDMSSEYLVWSQFPNRVDISFPIWAPVICWNRWHSSKTTPTLPSISVLSSDPKILMLPESMMFAPVMHLISVVLPAPFSPMRPTTYP